MAKPFCRVGTSSRRFISSGRYSPSKASVRTRGRRTAKSRATRAISRCWMYSTKYTCMICRPPTRAVPNTMSPISTTSEVLMAPLLTKPMTDCTPSGRLRLMMPASVAYTKR